MSRKLISVAVVTYNHEPFIEDCLRSVIAQRGEFELEVIVGEDYSTDGTRAIVARIAAESPGIVKPLLYPRNVGVHENWVSVLAACSGELIAQIDGDDLMRPGKLQAQLEFFNAHPEVALCFHNVRVFDHSTGATIGNFNQGDPGVRTLEALVRHGPVYCQTSKMFRRSALPPEGIDPTTRHIKDYQLHLQNARAGDVGYIDQVLGDYRKHSGGTTSMPLTRQNELVRDLLYTVEKGGEYGAPPDAVAEGKARVLFAAAIRYLEGGLDEPFRHAISGSVLPDRWLNPRQRLLYLGRNWPSILRPLAHAYKLMSKLQAHPSARPAASAPYANR